MKKVLFISSTGGHLNELLQLKPMFQKYDSYIVTENTKSNLKLKEEYGDKISFLVYGTKIRPKVIITTGAHTAGPMCCIGKIFGSKIIYIETFANISSRTMTGNLIYKFADLFIVQWEEMLKLYPKAVYWGWIF